MVKFQLNTESDLGLELNGFEGFSTANIQNDSTLPIRGSTVMEDPKEEQHPHKEDNDDDDDTPFELENNGHLLSAGGYDDSPDQESRPLNES